MVTHANRILDITNRIIHMKDGKLASICNCVRTDNKLEEKLFMSEQQIFKKVQSVVAEELANEQQQVTLNANFTRDLGADYLDLVAIFQALEDAFNTKIPRQDTTQLVTVQQVVNYIGQKYLV